VAGGGEMGKWLGATREIVAVQIERKHGTHSYADRPLLAAHYERISQKKGKIREKNRRQDKKVLAKRSRERGEEGTGAAGSLTTSCKRIKSKNSLKLCWPCIKCNSMQADSFPFPFPFSADPPTAPAVLYPSSCLRLPGHLMRPLLGVKYSFGQWPWKIEEMPKNGQVFCWPSEKVMPHVKSCQEKGP